MRAQFSLTVHESKRLIAKGVKALPTVQKALQEHTIIIAGGTTNGYVAEELLGVEIPEKINYTVGVVTGGKTGNSPEDSRVHPFVVTKGQAQNIHWKEYLPQMESGDIFIKGGSALDHTGLAAVMVSNSAGGTIGTALGTLLARGIELLVPIGLEKMVPDVRQAVEYMASARVDEAIGDKVSLIPTLGGKAITELTALETLFKVKATCIAAGGVSGSEGAVTIVVEGEEAEVQKVLSEIRSIKGV